MPQITDLKELLKHEIMDLYSAEQQIIEALPAMIEKAGNQDLKNALQEHLKITEKQKTRLEEIQQSMTDENAVEGNEQNLEQNNDSEQNNNGGSRKGFFSRLFGGGEQKCKGMEGLINEGNKMMGEDMSPEVADAAIIASAQKIEHYEISGYGTARAYARELNLSEVAGKLEQTLNEEYEADDRLTALAVGKVNLEAESPAESQNKNETSKAAPKKSAAKSGNNVAVLKNTRAGSNSKSASKKSSKSAPGKSRSSASKSGSRPALKSVSKSSPSKTSPSKSSPSKTASKSGASKKASSSYSRNAALKSAAKSKSGGNSKASGAKKSSAKKSSPGKSKSSGTKTRSSRRR